MLENSEKFPETRAQGNIFKTLFFCWTNCLKPEDIRFTKAANLQI